MLRVSASSSRISKRKILRLIVTVALMHISINASHYLMHALVNALWRCATISLRRPRLPQWRHKLLQYNPANSAKLVLVYGATNSVGTKVAKLLHTKLGYSLVLVDTDLSKL